MKLDIDKVGIIFDQGLKGAKSFLNIDKDAEERILKILKGSLSDREVLINLLVPSRHHIATKVSPIYTFPS